MKIIYIEHELEIEDSYKSNLIYSSIFVKVQGTLVSV